MLIHASITCEKIDIHLSDIDGNKKGHNFIFSRKKIIRLCTDIKSKIWHSSSQHKIRKLMPCKQSERFRDCFKNSCEYNSNILIKNIISPNIKSYNKMKMQRKSPISQKQNQHLIQIQNQLSFLSQQKKYEQMLPLYNSLIDIQSNNFQLYFRRAQVNFQLSRHKQCILDCETALQVQKIKKTVNNDRNVGQSLSVYRNIKIYSLICRSYIEIQDYDAAQEKMSSIIASNPQLQQLFKVKTAIQRLKQPYRYKLSDTQQKILQDTKKWLYQAGSKYDKIKVLKLGDEYRGAIATKHIKQNEQVVFVPYSHMITLQMAKQTKMAISLLQKKIQLFSPKHTLLSILLLQQARKPDSEWKLYIDILPKDLSSFPVNYTKQQLMELTGSSFLFQIHQKVIDLKRDYDTIYAVQNEFRKYTFKDFCWARMIIGSRIFGLIIDGVKTQALVPFADMLNHKIPKQTVWNYSQQLNGFVIESQQQIMPGQQVFDSYGKKCNSRFLLNYAFVLKNNLDNQVCFRMDLDEKDPHLEMKLQMMKDKSQIRVYRLSISMQDNNFYELLGFIRFYKIKDIQTLQLLQKISGIKNTGEPYKPTRTPPVNIKLQISVWHHIKKMCLQALNAYPTTYQQDMNMIKNKSLQHNMKNILQIRIGQKKIFLYYIAVGNQIIDLLSKGRKQAYQYAKDNSQTPYCKYLAKILPLLLHTANDDSKGSNPKRQSKSSSSTKPGN